MSFVTLHYTLLLLLLLLICYLSRYEEGKNQRTDTLEAEEAGEREYLALP